ncbi:MAG TPA: hypothetical protein PKD79_01065 [Candidatus Doudnabacteria bacterium]|nr:hypothetical protein [Candidatus Doudnabacteria bacterium]
MALDRKVNNSEEPLWCLVDYGCHTTSMSLIAETKAARAARHAGNRPTDQKETLREFDDDINRFINHNRDEGRHEVLLKLVAAISSEAAIFEARKI